MKRTNTFAVRPRSDADERLLRSLLDASASLWNERTYERRKHYFEGESVWETADYRQRDVGLTGSPTPQQRMRKSGTAWESFFSFMAKYEDPEDDEVTERPSPPGYWGNEDEGRELRTYIRKDVYTVETGDRSRLEIPVGKHLKDEFGFGPRERLRLEVVGEPRWSGEQDRLEIQYDEVADMYRAFQPVTVPDDRQDAPLASEEAALDVGANTLVACTTTTGRQWLYEGCAQFARFRETTEEIARLQSTLREGGYTSRRIRRLYRTRTRRRDHAQSALIRDLVERLYEDGVSIIYVGDLSDVLSTHWSAEVDEKTHQFWAFDALVDRLAETAAAYGITVEVDSEAYTTAECPACGERDATERTGDIFRCPCGYEGHADLGASRTFLAQQTGRTAVRPMARPVRLAWDDHVWSESTCSPGRERPREERTDRSTGDGKFASMGA